MISEPLSFLSSLITDQLGEPDLSQLTLSDWRLLEFTSDHHGVAPLIFTKLNRFGYLGQLPGQVQSFYRDQYYQSAVDNILLLDELNRILTPLRDAGIAVMLLKGISLVEKIYPDPALRPMTDIDLMVHSDDLSKVTKIFRRLGYTEQKSTYHLVFSRGSPKNLVVEIHWNMINSNLATPISEEEWIWNDAVFDGIAYRLRLEKELLYLAGHISIQHQDPVPRLIWLYDLHLLIEKNMNTLDWDFLLQNTRLLGWGRGLSSTLLKTVEFFPSEINHQIPGILPDQVDLEIGSREFQRIIHRTLRNMNFWRGIKTIKGLVFPGFHYMQWRYHLASRKAILLYYPRRWFELVRVVIKKR